MRSTMMLVSITVLLGCGPGTAGDHGDEVGESSSTSEGEGESETSDQDDDSTSAGGACPELIVHEGSLIITSATEIPDYECVVEITGGLEFEGVADIVDLDGFPRLERVGGVLFVAWTDKLVRISGFPELRQVGSLLIYDNAGLERIDGFTKLEQVDEDLRLEDLDQLVAIDGLSALSSVGEWLFVRFAPKLPNLSPFVSIQSVGEQIDIAYCDGLVDLDGLAGLSALPDTRIRENGGLLSLAGLDGITSAYELEILDNDELVDLGSLAGLTSVDYDLRVSGNASLTSLAGLDSVSFVGGDLEIIQNDALVGIVEPDIPMTVGGQVQICGNPTLAELPLPAMSQVGGVAVIRNASLANADALAFVTALGYPDAKIGGNEDLADYPVDPCPWIGDGWCDEPEKASGDVVGICDLQTGNGCCEIGGPTGLCLLESEGEPDCPPIVSPW